MSEKFIVTEDQFLEWLLCQGLHTEFIQTDNDRYGFLENYYESIDFGNPIEVFVDADSQEAEYWILLIIKNHITEEAEQYIWVQEWLEDLYNMIRTYCKGQLFGWTILYYLDKQQDMIKYTPE
jgi:hypothetical protein